MVNVRVQLKCNGCGSEAVQSLDEIVNSFRCHGCKSNHSDRFQDDASRFAAYRNNIKVKLKGMTEDEVVDLLSMCYVVLGLNGESGEIANLLKKIIRHPTLTGPTAADRDKFIDEASDVAWYMAGVSSELGEKLSGVFRYNIEKLTARLERGTLLERNPDGSPK